MNKNFNTYLEDFSRPKLLYSEIVREPQFYLDGKGVFVPEATVFIMTGRGIEPLYHIFHSHITTYIFKRFYAGGGLGEDGYRYKKAFFEKLPIPLQLIALDVNESNVDEILMLTYGFNEDERKFIVQQSYQHT